MNCGVGCRCGSDPTLLWLWCRPTAIAPIRPLAWELLYAMGVALKNKQQKTKQKQRIDSYIRPDNKMEEYRFGIIYIDEDDEIHVEDIKNVESYFNAIPDDSETTITYKKDEPVEIVVKPVKFSKEDTK